MKNLSKLQFCWLVNVLVLVLVATPATAYSMAIKSTRIVYPRVFRLFTSYSINIATNSFEGSVDDNSTQTLKKKAVKCRQHVNPLSRQYQKPVELPSTWLQSEFGAFGSIQPIRIDVGCAKGSWALNMAKEDPATNYLGLEIRRPLVDFALQRKANMNLTNLHYLAVNANVDIERILSDVSVQKIPIRTLSIQFPDPQFKLRNRKRRVVNDQFVETIAKYCATGTDVFLQSDIEEVAQDMVDHFSRNANFTPAAGYSPVDLDTNDSCMPVQTEREIATLAKGLPVYRMLFTRL